MSFLSRVMMSMIFVLCAVLYFGRPVRALENNSVDGVLIIDALQC